MSEKFHAEPSAPIIIIDDDEEDQYFFTTILQKLLPQRECFTFHSGDDALHYLKTTQVRPFLIITEVKLRKMDGLELRRQIELDPELKEKAIPFIFFSHPVHLHDVKEAYELPIQGYFEKASNMKKVEQQLKSIVDYWQACLHPNSPQFLQ